MFYLEAYCYDRSDNEKYNYDCSSYDAYVLFHGHEEELLKNIYVRINDCPTWSRDVLWKIRMNQLKEEKIKREKELRRQKNLRLIKKMFPFIKK